MKQDGNCSMLWAYSRVNATAAVYVRFSHGICLLERGALGGAIQDWSKTCIGFTSLDEGLVWIRRTYHGFSVVLGLKLS
jgi:hypothetical protein